MVAITKRTRFRVDAFLTAEELARLDRAATLKDQSRAGFVRDALLLAVMGVERARALGPVPQASIDAARDRTPINATRMRREPKPRGRPRGSGGTP